MRKSKSNTKRFKLSVTNYAKFITKDKALPCKINKLPKGQCSRNWRGPGQKDKNDVILSIFISLDEQDEKLVCIRYSVHGIS